ncbi:hypothetical protein D9M68_627030 [compost metagenome]
MSVSRSARMLLKSRFPDKYNELIGGRFDGMFDYGGRSRVSRFLLFGDVGSLSSNELLFKCGCLRALSVLYLLVFLFLISLFIFGRMGR